VATPGPGRPRRYCRASCRQRDYEARQRAHAHGLDDSEIIVARRELDELHDARQYRRGRPGPGVATIGRPHHRHLPDFVT
jgi:hypothetical protein